MSGRTSNSGDAMTIEEIDLYWLKDDDLRRYLPGKDCGECGTPDCAGFANALLMGKRKAGDCPYLDRKMAEVMDSICALDIHLGESDPMLRKVPDPLLEINGPDASSPVILTSSSVITIDILRQVLTAAGSKCFIVPMDTKGYTVDNSVHEGTITQMAIMKAMAGSGIGERVSHRTLLIPGLAAELKGLVERIARWTVKVGPVSGFELPLFLLTEWTE